MTPSFPLYIGLPHLSDLKRFFKLLPARHDQRAPLPPSPPSPSRLDSEALCSARGSFYIRFLLLVFFFFLFLFLSPQPPLPMVLKAKQAPGGGELRARGWVGPPSRRHARDASATVKALPSLRGTQERRAWRLLGRAGPRRPLRPSRCFQGPVHPHLPWMRRQLLPSP